MKLLIDDYTVAASPQRTPVIVFYNDYGGGIAHRPDYTFEEAQQVADWLNGRDKPLPQINVGDRPGLKQHPMPVVMRPTCYLRECLPTD